MPTIEEQTDSAQCKALKALLRDALISAKNSEEAVFLFSLLCGESDSLSDSPLHFVSYRDLLLVFLISQAQQTRMELQRAQEEKAACLQHIQVRYTLYGATSGN